MISELIPFWSNYWFYILISIFTYIYILWMIPRVKSKIENERNRKKDETETSDNEEGNFEFLTNSFFFNEFLIIVLENSIFLQSFAQFIVTPKINFFLSTYQC